MVEADNSFGLEVFQRLNETEKGNFNISPLSISQALAMTYNGARGETKAAMEEALKKAGFTTDEINQSYQSLVKALLGADSKVTLEIAQSIWYRKGFNVLFQNENSGGEWSLPIRNDSLISGSNQDLLGSGRLAMHFGHLKSPWKASLSLGRYFREPELMEQYGVYRNVLPNPDLKEETGWMGEISLSWKSASEKTKILSTYFETHQKNGIIWVTNNSFSKPFNISKAITRGVELSLESKPTSFFKTRLDATIQKALDDSSDPLYQGKKLPEEPTTT